MDAKKRIFMPGATGYIGRVVADLAVKQGYEVRGLSRSEEGDARLKALGATPVRGDLTSFDILRSESAQADIVIHLAYIHDFFMDYNEILRIDAAAVDAMTEPLRGKETPFVVTSLTSLIEPDVGGEETNEETEPMRKPIFQRLEAENHSLSKKDKGVRVSVIRLPSYVYGRGASGFVPIMMKMAMKFGESCYIDEGNVRTSNVHVDDAARLYLPVAENAKAGEIFNCTASTTITTREIAETVGEVLRLPVRSIDREEGEKRFMPMLTKVLMLENRASNRKIVERFGWQPKEMNILNDIKSGSYKELARKLLEGEVASDVTTI